MIGKSVVTMTKFRRVNVNKDVNETNIWIQTAQQINLPIDTRGFHSFPLIFPLIFR